MPDSWRTQCSADMGIGADNCNSTLTSRNSCPAIIRVRMSPQLEHNSRFGATRDWAPQIRQSTVTGTDSKESVEAAAQLPARMRLKALASRPNSTSDSGPTSMVMLLTTIAP